MGITITLEVPHVECLIAISLIEKLFKINDIKKNIEICYDYSLEDRGLYYTGTDKIYVNPLNCIDLNCTNNENKCYFGYTNDLSIIGVIIHEFCHFLADRIYKNITEDFASTFSTTRLYLNDNSNVKDFSEELAEIMTLYISNPLLLKMISKPHYDFLKIYFKSCIASTTKRFFEIYSNFPSEVKKELFEKWRITFNIDKNKFEKHPIEKEIINSK